MNHNLYYLVCSVCGDSVGHRADDREDYIPHVQELRTTIECTNYLDKLVKELEKKDYGFRRFMNNTCFAVGNCEHFYHGKCLFKHVLFEIKSRPLQLQQFKSVKCMEPECEVRFSSSVQFRVFDQALCCIRHAHVSRWDRQGNRDKKDRNYVPKKLKEEFLAAREQPDRAAKNRGKEDLSSSSSSCGTSRPAEGGNRRQEQRRKISRTPMLCLKKLKLTDEQEASLSRSHRFNYGSDTNEQTSPHRNSERDAEYNQVESFAENSEASKDRESGSDNWMDTTDNNQLVVYKRKESSESDWMDYPDIAPAENISAVELSHLKQIEGPPDKAGESSQVIMNWMNGSSGPYNAIPIAASCPENAALALCQLEGQKSESRELGGNADQVGPDIVDIALQRAFEPEASTSSAGLSQDTLRCFEEILALEGGTYTVKNGKLVCVEANEACSNEGDNKMEQEDGDKQVEQEDDEQLTVEVTEMAQEEDDDDDEVQYCGTTAVERKIPVKRVIRPAELIDLTDSEGEETSSASFNDSTSNTSGTRNNSEAEVGMAEADSSTSEVVNPCPHNYKVEMGGQKVETGMQMQVKLEVKVEASIKNEVKGFMNKGGQVAGSVNEGGQVVGSVNEGGQVEGSFMMGEYTDKKKHYRFYCSQVKIGRPSNMDTSGGLCSGGDASRPSDVQCVNSRAREVKESGNNVGADQFQGGNLACSWNGEEMQGLNETSRMEED